VYAPDLVGSGESDKPLDLRYSVENVARFIAAYVRMVSREPVYVVGNSLGGLYTLRAIMNDVGHAAERPIARRFVLMHAPGYPLVRTRLLSAIFQAPALGPAALGLVAHTAHRFPEQFVEKNVHYARRDIMSQEECAEYGRLFETIDGARVFAKILQDSLDPAEHRAIIRELQARARTGWALSCPVKVLYAKKDVMVPPSFGPRFQRDIPGSELVWMEDASHFLQVDAPERTVLEITSFDRVDAASMTA
jgi:pimeloyl-ACP methyl ester carboxylesterase